MKATEFILESDKEHRAALNQTGFWGKQGAGCLFLATDTGRICIAHRSQAVEQPGTWGTWGGAIDSGEDPAAAVRREVKEEAGYTGKLNLIPLYVFSHPSGFKYYNFLALVDKEFTPITDWETQGSAWFDYGRWPKPLHPGLVTLLSDSASTAIIQKYAQAKTEAVRQQFEARPDKATMKSIEKHYSKYKNNDHGTISDYTSGEGSFDSSSQYLNKPLYKAKGAVPKEIQSWTDRTDALVARHKTPKDMTAYYGISRNPKLFSYGSNLIKNNKKTITAPFVFVNHGYTSTSLDPDIAWTFARNQLIDSSNKSVHQAHIMIIKIPKGFSGAYVGHLSAQKERYGGRWDEMELILPRGTSFTISPNPSVIKKTVPGTTLYVFKWKTVAVPPVAAQMVDEAPLPPDWDEKQYQPGTSFKSRLAYALDHAKKLGAGSSRVAVTIEYQGRPTVLKIAKNTRGLGQNAAEASVLNDGYARQMGILIPLIDYDKQNPEPTWIQTELAQRASKQQLCAIMKCDTLVQLVAMARAIKGVGKYQQNYADFVKSQLSHKSEQDIETMTEYADKLADLDSQFDVLISDLSREANWGIYQGDPVIIDVGYTSNVRKQYYSR